MDVALLSVLRELAERGSVTAVAAATHRTPSAVSQQLRTLQEQAGTALVERHGRGVRLTAAGEFLARSAIGVDTAIAEAEAAWEAFRGGASGTVRMTMFPSAAELLLPGLLTRMRALRGVELRVADLDVPESDFPGHAADHDLVVGHRSDGVPPADRSRLDTVPLLREPLDVAVPLGHPLAGRERVGVEEVIGDTWVGVPDDYPIGRVLVAMAARAEVVPRVAFRSIHLTVLEALVAAGHGIALMPRYTSRTRAAGRFHLAVLADVRAGRRIEALVRPDRAVRPAVRTVLEALVAEATAVAS